MTFKKNKQYYIKMRKDGDNAELVDDENLRYYADPEMYIIHKIDTTHVVKVGLTITDD